MNYRFCKIIILLVSLLTTFSSKALAYEVETHAYLTKQAIERLGVNLDGDEIEAIIQGSKDEDKAGRPLNHFYDFIRNRGLTIGVYQWYSSKEWAENNQAQNALRPLLAFLGRIINKDIETDFTWQAALAAYRQGNKKKAFYALGHIIHLIQDLTVPAHTRNDPHLYGDPYEKFAKDRKATLINEKQAPHYNNLTEYFDDLSRYVNQHFYSQDTIGLSYYKSPQPSYQKVIGKYVYLIREENGKEHYLARKAGKSLLAANKVNLTVSDPLVLEDYWEQLAPMAVDYSAAVINLFLEKINSPYLNKSLPHLNSSQDDYAIGRKDKESIANKYDTSYSGTALTGQVSQVLSEKPVDGSLAKANQQAMGGIAQKASVFLPDNDDGIEKGKVVISRFLFDEKGSDKGSEFIELCNVARKPIHLKGWRIETSSKSKSFDDDMVIKPGASFLIWLGGDHPEADMVWLSGSLKNSADSISLIAGDQLIDKVIYDKADLPGFEPGKMMEKNIYCRPAINYAKEVYSPVYKKERLTAKGRTTLSSQSHLNDADNKQSAESKTTQSSDAEQTAGNVNNFEDLVGKLVISEFLFDYPGNDTGHEYIKVCNVADQPIKVSGMEIQVGSKKKLFPDNAVFTPKESFFIRLGKDDAQADMSWKSGSLKNEKDYIALLFDGEIVDEVAYDKNAIAGFEPGQSIVVNDSCGGTLSSIQGEDSHQQSSSDNSLSVDQSSGVKTYFTVEYKRQGITLHFNKYPIVDGRKDAWKIVVFYKNRLPIDNFQSRYAQTSSSWLPRGVDEDALLTIAYPYYAGTALKRKSLILPDNEQGFGSGGGIMNHAYNYRKISQDGVIQASIMEDKLPAYITWAVYDFSHSGGGEQVFKLAAVGNQKIYLSE